MFILTTIEDLIQLTPESFSLPSKEAIKDAINTKYSNKVIQNIGLCICLWDLLKASDGNIGHGSDCVNVNVEFRMLVFRPFRGEIILGKIVHSSQSGITIGLEFTRDIFIPPSNLPENTAFNHAENVWVWNTDGNELFFDLNEPVLFRVEQEQWFDQRPTVVQKDEEGNVVEERETPWKVVGSMALAGLGPTLWWGEPEEGEEQDEYGKEAEDMVEDL